MKPQISTKETDDQEHYSIEYANGRVTEFNADNDADAIEWACRRIGDDAVHGDWQCRNGSTAVNKMFIWADKKFSKKDNGAGSWACAQLIR